MHAMQRCHAELQTELSKDLMLTDRAYVFNLPSPSIARS